MLVLVFVLSHRKNNIDLYTEAFDELIFLFFGLDLPNYSRWRPVHIRNMKFLNTEAKSVLSKSWVVQKKNYRFSTLPLDHAQEQENINVNGKGSIIGLTEYPEALKNRII